MKLDVQLILYCIGYFVVWMSIMPSHLVSSLPSEAEGFKEKGNVFYSKKDYSEAFNYYTKAIGEIAIALESRCFLFMYFSVFERKFEM